MREHRHPGRPKGRSESVPQLTASPEVLGRALDELHERLKSDPDAFQEEWESLRVKFVPADPESQEVTRPRQYVLTGRGAARRPGSGS